MADDAEDVVERDVYETLNVAAVTDQVQLFQHVPQDTPIDAKGVLIIGDMDAEPIATKDGQDQTVRVSLAAVIDGEERRPIRQLKATVMALLHGRQVERDGWRLAYFFEASDAFLDPETAQAYVGNFRFTCLAFQLG